MVLQKEAETVGFRFSLNNVFIFALVLDVDFHWVWTTGMPVPFSQNFNLADFLMFHNHELLAQVFLTLIRRNSERPVLWEFLSRKELNKFGVWIEI